MTVHAIYGAVAPDSGLSDAEVEARVDDWISKRVKWDGDDWTATVTRETAGPGTTGSPYLRVRVRFEWSEDKDNLLQKFGDKLVNKVDWFAVVYHECTHDAGPGAPDCPAPWGERREWTDKGVTIPSDVEQAIPDAATVVARST